MTQISTIKQVDVTKPKEKLNVTNDSKVLVYGKFDRLRGHQSFRCNDYTYDQFITPKWNDFVELAIR